jgi:hypothetical protein
MRARSILLAALLSLAFGTVYAVGGADCNGFGNCNPDNSITNKAYGGDGGDAYSKAYGGDADAKAKAEVDIYNSNKNYNTNLNSQKLYNTNVGINKQGQGQGQDQDQYQGQDQGQGQLQGQVGIVKDGDQVLIIKDNSVRKVEAEPAIAPDISPPDPTAPCLATYGGGAAGGGVVSLGFSAYEYDEICGALEFYRVAGGTHAELADVAIKLAHAMLLKKIKAEMGDEDYNAALNPEQTAATPAEDGTTASLDVAYASGINGSDGR